MKFYYKLFGILLLSVLFQACSQANAEKPDQSLTQSDLPVYQTIRLKNDTLNYRLTLPGDLLPYEQVTLYAKIEGFVRELNVDRGDQVEKGQVLAVIEAPEVEQQFLSAKSKEREILEKLSFSSQNYKYLQKAASVDGAVSAIEVEQARSRFMADSAAWNAVKAEVSAAEHLSKYRTITAPFSGIVTERMVSAGALVGGEKQALFNISREDKLRLTVAIPGKHANALQAGATADFSVNAYPGKLFPIVLSRSSKVLNQNLRSSIVEYDVENAQGLLNAGDYADVNINFTRNTGSLRVPANAIINSKTGKFVAKVNAGKTELIPVITGISYEGKIEVFGDLQEEDEIIARANSALKDGLEVRTETEDLADNQ